MSNEKETEAAAFREWFASQQKYGSLSAMERALDITKYYLHLIKDGKRRAVDPILRQKLYEATGLAVFKSISTIIQPKTMTSQLAATRNINEVPNIPSAHKESRIPDNLSESLKTALKKLKLTTSECAEKYGVSPDTLQKYKSGARRPSSEKNVTVVLNILKDAELSISAQTPFAKKPLTVSSQPADVKELTREVSALRKRIDEIDNRLSIAKLYKMPESKQEFMNTETRAKRVMQILLNLSNELEFFKQCPESGRTVFKKIVPGPDVGYVTTLLRALYDEDKFQRWLLFSNYEMRGKNNGN